MKKNVQVLSDSSEGLYEVFLKNDNGILSFNCTCQSGLSKGICKHRMNLLKGNFSSLANESDIAEVQEFLSSIDKSKVDKYFEDLTSLEKQFDKKLRQIKKQQSDELRTYKKRFCDGF